MACFEAADRLEPGHSLQERIAHRSETDPGGALAEAEEMERRVSLGKKQYSDALKRARASGYKLAEERRSEAIREREARLTSLKAEIEAAVLQERTVIARQASEARREFEPLTLAKRIRDQILKPLGDSGRTD